jgi:mono/diheme cytochrome c family protein/glucose/arabinose dehydrogenase
MFIRTLLITLATASVALAQSGDKIGEVQTARVPKEKIPPAPILTPEDGLKSLKVQPGFRVELVAAEPLIHDPVQIAFDPDGRLWVMELRGYMPNVEGTGEFEKIGSLAVLEDTDGDGRMDKRTEFLSGLVMARSFALVNGGVLVAEPPNLWFWRDTDGDGKADAKSPVVKDYATAADPKYGPKANPEHASNGLMLGLDNWIYSANHTVRYRFADEDWKREPTTFRGQWGISQDDFGRLVYNSNSDQLRLDLVPSAYLNRNPFYRGGVGLNWQPQKSQEVWPIRVNPGVNRGYQEKQLRPDGTLATYTAACGPVIYRGDNFPADCKGNAFICEPAGNLVRRNVLNEQGLLITAQNAYDKAEFLASTDERFRPVNLNNGPDGALYVVDLHRGLIQHRIYVTSYLRKQAEDRNLTGPPGLGRIYRVVAEGRPLGKKPALSKATPEELVKHLSHANGWWRDTAQRLLVEKNSGASIPLLKQLATAGTDPMGRLHALWTLEGLGQLDVATLTNVLKAEQHSKIRATAIRLCEPYLKTDAKADVLPKLLAQLTVNHLDIQLQLAFTLGEVSDLKAEEAMAVIARNHATNDLIRTALISGLALRETEFAERLLADAKWKEAAPAREQLLTALARSVTAHGRGERVGKLLEVIAKTSVSWQQKALLNGMVASTPPSTGKKDKKQPAPRVKRVRLQAESAALAALKKSPDKSIKDLVKGVDDFVVWPGKPGVAPEPPVKPLTAAQATRFEQGRQLYAVSCGACHQAHGFGQEGLAPPLVDSEWVMGSEQRLARILLHGLTGPLTVKGQKYDLDMPAHGTFDDEQLASILTYIRREWEHTFDPIDPGAIKKAREAHAKREESWTQEELLKIK